jgi:hypothetical protein
LSVISSRGDAAQLDGLREGFQDRERLPTRDGPDAEQEAAEVIDEGDKVAGSPPGRRARQAEGTLEVDVPELVRARPLVAGTRHARRARAVRARTCQQAVDLAMAHCDASPVELGGDPAAVPVAQHPHEEDRPLEARSKTAHVARSGMVNEPGEAVALERLPPAERVARLQPPAVHAPTTGAPSAHRRIVRARPRTTAAGSGPPPLPLAAHPGRGCCADRLNPPGPSW